MNPELEGFKVGRLSMERITAICLSNRRFAYSYSVFSIGTIAWLLKVPSEPP